MERFFESKPVIYLSKFIDLVVLNVFFLVCCIPVVTIGAAWTAMYYTCVKVVRRDCGKLCREYVHSFRDNIKTATAVWLFLLLAAGLLSVAVYQLLISGGEILSTLLLGLCMALLLFLIAVLIYAFPVLSRFTVTGRGLLKNAVVLSVKHGEKTISMVVLTLGFATLIVVGWKFLPLILLIMPGVYTLLLSLIMERILVIYTPDPFAGEETAGDNVISGEDMLYTEERKQKPWYLEGGEEDE